MIFITGCNGLIGSFITRKLLSSGYQVRALLRPTSNTDLIGDIKDQIEFVEGDISDVPLLKNSLTNVDTVIHTAALVSYQPKDRDLIYKVNVEGTANLVNAALTANVSRFLHLSSVAALGKPKELKVINEEVVYTESSSNSHYGRSKYLAELEVFRGMEEGLKVLLVNPSVVLGPGNWKNGSSAIFKFVYDKNPFYSKGKVNYIDVRDVATIVASLLPLIDQNNGERFILNAGQINYQDLFCKIADSFQVKRPSIEVGPVLSALAWRIEAIKSIFSGKDPLITRETARLSKSQYYYDNQKIQKKLSYSFITLDETVKWTCRKFLEKESLSVQPA